MDELRYPTGRFTRPDALTADQRRAAIETIATTPGQMRGAVRGRTRGATDTPATTPGPRPAAGRGLTDVQLDTPYRPGGWTVRQLVHHVPDSHANAYVRCKLALTEERPAIKTYEEKLWAELPDARRAPVE